MASAKKSKPDGDKVRVKDLILDEACKAFSENGFQRTKTLGICEKLGIRPSAVNYHFGSKEGLYLAVWDKAVQDAVDTAALTPVTTNEERKWLYSYVRASFMSMFEMGGGIVLHKLLLHELQNPSPMHDEAMERLAPSSRNLERCLVRMLGRGVSDRQIACCVVAITSQCVALGLTSRMKQRLFLYDKPSEEEVTQFSRDLCAFIIGGVRAMRGAVAPGAEPRQAGQPPLGAANNGGAAQ